MLQTKCPDYETAMSQAASKIDELNKSLEVIGFEKESVKTLPEREICLGSLLLVVG